MAAESVKVAVRVRPFNQREKDRNAKLIVKMIDQSTLLTNPDSDEKPKQFTFDYSYWSHDGCREEANGYLVPDTPKSNYASQQLVFDNLGVSILDNAFEGFNCSLFAYGQTGSGKSYSVVGYGCNKGIVPMACEELFKRIEGNNDSKKTYEITFSMLEIYNEQARDLLTKENPKGGLPVRQHPGKNSFYAQDLKQVPVGSYAEIQMRIDEGTANRTVASTNMNATSSRAHTVATVTFNQLFNTDAGVTKKTSIINLIDLAGSERADSSGATGDRLKEGANINKSLSALGNCISVLADLSANPKKKVVIPYRESILTKLLQNALGGNSKTIMVAAISPADINYEETLSTLRYADRAKQIKNVAVVNDNPIEKMMRELKVRPTVCIELKRRTSELGFEFFKEENEKLRLIIQNGTYPTGMEQYGANESMSPKEIEAMRKKIEDEIRAQLENNQLVLAEVSKSWSEKLSQAQKESANELKGVVLKEKRKDKEPYLTNLNEDPLLSNIICHFLNEKLTKFGTSAKSNVQLHGLGILEEHAIVKNENGEIEICVAHPAAKIKVNGIDLKNSRMLEHQDRILFGSSNMYIFMDPKSKGKDKKGQSKVINWEFAQKEIAEVKGLATNNRKLSKDQQIIQEEVIQLLPLIAEANAISEELNKYILFEIIMIPGVVLDDKDNANNVRVAVKVINLLNQNAWMWTRGKFMNRRYLMLDHYQKYLEGEEDILYMKKEEDPFWEPVDNLFIGVANAFLQSLAYFMDFNDKLVINNYKGEEIGTLNIALIPCSQQGKPLENDLFNEDPMNLLLKPYYFKIILRSCEMKTSRYVKFILKYKFFNETEYSECCFKINGSGRTALHSRIITIQSMNKEHLTHFENGFITFLFYTVQQEISTDDKLFRMTTKELKQMRDSEDKQHLSRKDSLTQYIKGDMDFAHLKSEFILLQKKHARYEQKEKQLQKLCFDWSKKKENDSFFEFYKSVCELVEASNTTLNKTIDNISKLTQISERSKVPEEHFNHDDVLTNGTHRNGSTNERLKPNSSSKAKLSATQSASAPLRNNNNQNEQSTVKGGSKTCTIN